MLKVKENNFSAFMAEFHHFLQSLYDCTEDCILSVLPMNEKNVTVIQMFNKKIVSCLILLSK